MCGFTGFVNKAIMNKQEIIEKMNSKIVHRGPDSSGIYTDDDVAMGFRRLSIIDLSHSNQPMFNEDKSVVITFNGEIYNYLELRQELIEKGHEFATDGDTEVIIHGYEEYGKEIVSKLRGMFAFVIWNKNTDELFGARDYFGIKPFYYSKVEGGLLFGSEIKSFLEYPHFNKELNKDAIKMYLVFQYSALEETVYKDTFRLRPGHFFTYKNGEMKIEKYFEINYNCVEKSYDEYVDILGKTLEDSVEAHKISDVEVGSYLSGGVDSSYVASVAMPQRTFSVGFDNKGFDETGYAKELSDILKIDNKKQLITPDEFFDILPTVQYHTDEPHANLSAVPLYYLARLAAKDVKVVLSGEGSDEMFAGYNEHAVTNFEEFYKKVPFGLRKGLGAVAKKMPAFKGKNFLLRYSQKVEDRYIGQAFIMDNDSANDILNDDFKSDLTYQQVTKPYYDKVKDQDELHKKLYLDMHFWLPNDILLKADKMTMANSLELRVPFLDKDVWDVARKIPSRYLTEKSTTKKVFRTVSEKKVPIDWAKRRKCGFPVPFSQWIREDKYYNMVKKSFENPKVGEILNHDKIMKLLDDHYAQKVNNGRKIYTIYCLAIWIETQY